ncbi:neuropeptide FF receptor 2 [Octopus bimaculoides]|nr:neuropeptide FF receptor 2 [Octopus bimaculoides]|eukprot:XP_014790986.1 PREDICTED: neuropeptide FF receptor 2-like [Octopus bimaculoides]
MDVYERINISYPMPRFKEHVLWEVTLKVVFYSLIVIFSLIGNLLIIVIVMRQKRMRTVTNFYIVNLAVADLLVTVCCSWVHLVDDLTEGWVLGAFFCKVNSFAQVVSLVASVFTLSLIAFDRFYGIVFALKAHMMERKAKGSLFCVWSCAIAVGCPILISRNLHVRVWLDHVERWCDDGWPIHSNTADPTSRRIYYTFVAIVLYVFPMLVMTFTYTIILWKLNSTAMPGETIEREVILQARMKRKVVIMLVSILFVFGICWLPYLISLLYSEYKSSDELSPWFYDLKFCAQYLADSNAALNPVIYVGFNENFRNGLRDTMRCMQKRNPEEIMMRRNNSAYQSTSVTNL